MPYAGTIEIVDYKKIDRLSHMRYYKKDFLNNRLSDKITGLTTLMMLYFKHNSMNPVSWESMDL